MNPLAQICQKSDDRGFVERLLDAVGRTGYDRILPDHLLSAWLMDESSLPSRNLVQQGWDPASLAGLILENIPPANPPKMPPRSLCLEALDEQFVQACQTDAEPELGELISRHLNDRVRSVLEFGEALKPVEKAFSSPAEPEQVPEPVNFFAPDGELNRSAFTAKALQQIRSVEQAACELGHERITLPILFLGMARSGALKDFAAAFGSNLAEFLIELGRQLQKGPPAATTFSKPNLSASVERFVREQEKRLSDSGAEAFDEVLLASGLLLSDSNLLEGYWGSLGIRKKQACRMLSAAIDDSPINPPAEAQAVDFECIFERLNQRIIGQSQAIHRIMPVIRRWMLDFHFEDRPAGVLLFMGPTGVGKTELTKELAELLYEDRSKLCFIEMNQLKERHTVSQLIGSPPGYVGSESGKLTTHIQEHPESIILFDEVEKAHSACFDVLLRLLSEGRVQDASGREYDATKILVVLTSNIGQQEGLFDDLSESPSTVADPLSDPEVKDLLSRHFRQEFISRLTLVCLFGPLRREDYEGIGRLMVEKAQAKFSRRGVEVTVDDEVYERLAQLSQGRKQGARALRTLVESEVVDPVLAHLAMQPETGQVKVSLLKEGKERICVGSD